MIDLSNIMTAVEEFLEHVREVLEEFVDCIQDALGSYAAGLISGAFLAVFQKFNPFVWFVFLLIIIEGTIVALKEALHAGVAFAIAYLLIGVLIGDFELTILGLLAFFGPVMIKIIKNKCC